MHFLKSVWRILELVKPSRGVVLGAVLCTAAASVFQMASLGLIIPLLNGLVDPNEYEALLKIQAVSIFMDLLPVAPSNKVIFFTIIVLVLVSVYLENILLFLGQSFSARLTTDVAHKLRVMAFDRYLKFSKSFYDQANLGELNLLLTSLIVRVGQSFHDANRLLIVLSFTIAFFTMMLVISWRLTLCAVILLPIINWVSTTIAKKIRRSSENEVENLVELSDQSLDVLTNVALTQLTNQEDFELSRLSRSSEEIRRHGYNSRRKQYAAPRIVDMINSTGIIILVCVAVFLFLAIEASSIGRISIFFISLRRFTSHIEQLSSAWMQGISGIPTMEKILWIFDDNDKSFIESGGRSYPAETESIEFCDVSFSYTSHTVVLDKVGFRADRGTMTAVVGPTGSGKTTLVNLIPRFYESDPGTLLINGIDIREFKLGELRQRIAVVSQHSMLFQESICKNLTYGLREEVSEDQIIKALELARVLEFVSDLPDGMHTILGADGLRLSGGERQRLSIARAILRKPDILILDEATSALDAETELAVAETIDQMVQGKIVIVVAHRLSTIRRADQIVVLERGKVTECGSSSELLDIRGKFYEYCELQRIFV